MGIFIFLLKKTKKFSILKSLFRILIYLFILITAIIILKFPTKLKNILPKFSQFDILSGTELTEESLINEIKNVNKLIPLEIELSETMVLSNSYFNLDIFKKVKKITFFANCSYAIDFSNLSSNEVMLDNDTKKINILISEPEIFSIDIDESKTIYTKTELGLLRFGDLKLSSEELKILHEKLYDSFSSKMNDSRFYNQAISNTQDSLQKLLSNLTGENYKIVLELSNNIKNEE